MVAVARHRTVRAHPVADRAAPADDARAPAAARRLYAGKRALDLAIASVALIVTAPLVAALGVMIRVESRGPALFFQRRIGRGRRPFTLVKLRTMSAGRITRLGRVLRPSGLDELPQLWNVVRGDMSLIGPRPEIPERAAHHARALRDYHARHQVRPGITGWAQVNRLRGNVSIAERLRFDLDYVGRANLRFDGAILRATLSTVVRDTACALRGTAP